MEWLIILLQNLLSYEQCWQWYGVFVSPASGRPSVSVKLGSEDLSTFLPKVIFFVEGKLCFITSLFLDFIPVLDGNGGSWQGTNGGENDLNLSASDLWLEDNPEHFFGGLEVGGIESLLATDLIGARTRLAGLAWLGIDFGICFETVDTLGRSSCNDDGGDGDTISRSNIWCVNPSCFMQDIIWTASGPCLVLVFPVYNRLMTDLCKNNLIVWCILLVNRYNF